MSWQYWSKKKGGSLFFDVFGGGLGGFSFRKLVDSYTGRWGRAINVNTSEERDIFYVDNYCDTAELIDLSNGTDTVELLSYDNSFLQLYIYPDPGLRPILVQSGTLVTLGGMAAADLPLDRIGMSLSESSTIDPTPLTVVGLAKVDALNQRNHLVAPSSGNYGYQFGGTLAGYNGMSYTDEVYTVSSLNDEDLNRRLGWWSWSDSTTLKISSNGSGLSTFPGLTGPVAVRNIGIGQLASSQAFEGVIQEVLLFDSNKEAEYSEIITDINTFYGL